MLGAESSSAQTSSAARVGLMVIGELPVALARSAFRTQLEGLVECDILAAELSSDSAFLCVGSDEGGRLALLGPLVDVQHRVVDDLVDHGADDKRLLSAVARGPHAALLAGGGRRGRLDQRLG